MGAHEVLGVFSDAQEISSDNTASTNTVNTQQVTPKIGAAQEAPWLAIQTNTAPTATSNDTLAIELQSDADDGAGAPAGSWDRQVFSPLVGADGAEINQSDSRLATAGEWIYRAQLPMDLFQQHIRLIYRNSTSVGVFKIDAWLSAGPPTTFRGSQVIKSNVGLP